MKTFGELAEEMDLDDVGFKQFLAGWDAACSVLIENCFIDSSGYSDAQKAQLWGFFTGQIELPS